MLVPMKIWRKVLNWLPRPHGDWKLAFWLSVYGLVTTSSIAVLVDPERTIITSVTSAPINWTALATFLAVIVALFTPWLVDYLNGRRANAEAEERRIVLAAAIMPDLIKIRLRVEAIAPLIPATFHLAVSKGEMRFLDDVVLPVTPTLERNADNFYLLRYPASFDATSATTCILTYRDTLDTMRLRLSQIKDPKDSKHYAEQTETVRSMLGVYVNAACESIEPLVRKS